jgi:hypothetical protein
MRSFNSSQTDQKVKSLVFNAGVVFEGGSKISAKTSVSRPLRILYHFPPGGWRFDKKSCFYEIPAGFNAGPKPKVSKSGHFLGGVSKKGQKRGIFGYFGVFPGGVKKGGISRGSDTVLIQKP